MFCNVSQLEKNSLMIVVRGRSGVRPKFQREDLTDDKPRPSIISGGTEWKINKIFCLLSYLNGYYLYILIKWNVLLNVICVTLTGGPFKVSYYPSKGTNIVQENRLGPRTEPRGTHHKTEFQMKRHSYQQQLRNSSERLTQRYSPAVSVC